LNGNRLVAGKVRIKPAVRVAEDDGVVGKSDDGLEDLVGDRVARPIDFDLRRIDLVGPRRTDQNGNISEGQSLISFYGNR
jgi:hypothetical protein